MVFYHMLNEILFVREKAMALNSGKRDESEPWKVSCLLTVSLSIVDLYSRPWCIVGRYGPQHKELSRNADHPTKFLQWIPQK